jgi:excisionase family DNA binding protein
VIEQAAGDHVPRAEAARRLTVSKTTVARLAAAGKLEEIRPSPRCPRISTASIARLLSRRGQALDTDVTA